MNYQLAKLLKDNRYYRFQVRLNEGSDDMDDTSRANVRALKLLAEDLLRTESSTMRRLCSHLEREHGEATENP